MREALFDAVFTRSKRTELTTTEKRKKSVQWELRTTWDGSSLIEPMDRMT